MNYHLIFNKEKLKNIHTPFGPCVDYKSKNPVLPVPIEDAIKAGIHVPSMIGYNNKEGVVALRVAKKSKQFFFFFRIN